MARTRATVHRDARTGDALLSIVSCDSGGLYQHSTGQLTLERCCDLWMELERVIGEMRLADDAKKAGGQ